MAAGGEGGLTLRRIARPFIGLLLLVALALLFFERGIPELARLPGAPVFPTSEAAFDRWLAEDPDRAPRFRELQAFLQAEGVGNVVPVWQLTRVDAFYAARCGIVPFALPPEDLWDNIVAPLRSVERHVVPAVGPVQVLSSYRTPEVNACARGASRSRHLDFAALDLATQDRQRGEDLYRTLCAMHAEEGRAARMGLGAYFDPDEPSFGGGRFHIDAGGYRSWGRGYSAASSPCPRLR